MMLKWIPLPVPGELHCALPVKVDDSFLSYQPAFDTACPSLDAVIKEIMPSEKNSSVD
jgi:hypothetical protein